MTQKTNPILNLVNKVAHELGFKTPNDDDSQSTLVQEVDPLINDIKLSLDQLNAELDSYKTQVKTIKEECQRQDAQSRQLLNDSVRNTLKELFSQAATPCAMLSLQQHLHSQGKLASTDDMLLVSRQLLDVLVDNGLVLFGSPGQTVSFNPNKHVAANYDENYSEGDQVKIMSSGVEFDGYILQRAQVQSDA